MIQAARAATWQVSPALVAQVRRFGRFDTNGCLNCGSCTVVCDLAVAGAPFPRKTIRYAVIGLRGPLLASLEPWLCHDCGDCSDACPRQAEPAESMRTIRRYLTAQYDWTGLSSRILASRAWHFGSLAVVAAVVGLLIVLYHLAYSGMSLSELASTPMPFGHMFDTIITFTLAVYLIPLFLILSNACRMLHSCAAGGRGPRLRHYAAELGTMLMHLATHKQMTKCPQTASKTRWARHWLLAASLVIIFVLTCFFLEWFQTDNRYPLRHPQRWLGYLATAFMLYAAAEILIGRLRKRKTMHRFSEVSDLTLPVLLLLSALSGIAIHILRYAGSDLAAHYAYALHLVIVVPMLIIEVPFGKLAHMLYRPLALYLQAVSERALEPSTTLAAVPEPVAP